MKKGLKLPVDSATKSNCDLLIRAKKQHSEDETILPFKILMPRQ